LKSCLSSVNVQFTNSSTNAVSYLWTFYDSSSSTQTSPTKIFSPPADADAYVVHQPVSLNSTLTAKGAYGCTSSFTGTLEFQRPTALFSVDTTRGCAPLKVNFASRSYSSLDPITSFYWDFGDGTNATTTTGSVSHTYSTVGSFAANLIVTTASNCKDTSYNVAINTGKLPSPSFNLSSSNVCASDLVNITNTTPATDNVDFWQYTINGKNINSCPGDASPAFKLATADTGYLTIKLVAGNNGCFNQTSKTIHNNGPKASFSDSINCATNTVYFTGVTTGSNATWNFGDSGTGTGNLVNHHYPDNVDANYIVTYTSQNGTCSTTIVDTVRIRQLAASFSLPAEGCAGTAISFNGSGSHHLTDFCHDKYMWNFNDNSPLIKTGNDIVKHSFKNRGPYNVTLTALYDNGCTASVSHSITIRKPYAGLKADTTMGCPPLRVAFTDISTTDGGHAITSLRMHFGDFRPDTTSSNIGTKFSIHYYDYQQIFNARLTVTDAIGCIDSAKLPIKISQPNADFLINSDKNGNSIRYGCANSNVILQPSYLTADSVVWTFGDGTTSRAMTAPMTHSYKNVIPFQTKKYGITQKVYQYYCSSSFTDSVSIMSTDAKFTLLDPADSVINCPGGGKTVTFTHSYPSDKIISGEWTMGTPVKHFPYLYSNPSVVYTYTRAGYDTARLSVTTIAPYSCITTYSKVIRVKGPQGKMIISPDTACKGAEITFTVKDTLNVADFSIDYGDGSPHPYGTSLIHKHIYNTIGKKLVYLLLRSATCTPPGIPDSLYIREVIASYSVTDTSICEQVPIKFTNLSIGNNQYKWNFGDGVTSTLQSPQHAFGLGTFKVKLTVTDPIVGCKDSISKTMVVNPNPPVTVDIDKSKCNQNIAILHATGGDSIVWIPPTGLNNPNSYSPEASPPSSTNYVAKVIYKSTKCFKTDTVRITRASIDLAPKDTTAVIGDSVKIRVNSSSDISSFTWYSNSMSDLSCTNCLNPSIGTFDNNIYYLILTEPGKCFVDTVKVTIRVDTLNLIFNLPSAFKPGSDDKNRILYVRGRGIRELLEFKIFNRWGHMVYSSTDLYNGWDGTYQGREQPIDTYIWMVTVKTWGGQIIKKKGSVLLLR
jgi:gliding motility-associated-like protein